MSHLTLDTYSFIQLYFIQQLILDNKSKSKIIYNNEFSSFIEYKTSINKINNEKLFYLISCWLKAKNEIQLNIIDFIELFQRKYQWSMFQKIIKINVLIFCGNNMSHQ